MTFALLYAALYVRMIRANVMEAKNEDYVRTAHAKGASQSRVMRVHVLRNALLPLTTMLGFAFIGLFTGSFFVETITGIPGYGRLAFEAIGSRDYDMIMAITMTGAALFVIVSIFIDIAYTMVDPRVRYGSRNR